MLRCAPFLLFDKHARTINAHLQSGDIETSAADWMASPVRTPVQGNTTAIFVIGDDIDAMRSIPRRRSAGADASSVQTPRHAHRDLRTAVRPPRRPVDIPEPTERVVTLLAIT